MEDAWRQFDVAVCRWTVGDLEPQGLVDAAVSALAAGCEAPALIQLAVMDETTWSEFPPVVRRVFAERERSAPSFDEAVKGLADHLLTEMVARTADVRLATNRLYRLGAGLWEHPAYRDLAAFIGLDDAFACAEHGIFGNVDGSPRTLSRRPAKSSIGAGSP